MISRDWVGETAFVIAGGPSVAAQPLDRLRGRRVIVINSSFERVPWADILFFHDDRWWRRYGAKVLATFPGEIYTTWAVNNARVKRLRNSKPAKRRDRKPLPLQLSSDPRAVPMRRTSVAGALNIACIKGVTRIVCLGLDGKFGPNGERNHYASPYIWAHSRDTWERHQADLAPLVPQIEALGIKVVNASPGSAWTLWPIVALEDVL